MKLGMPPRADLALAAALAIIGVPGTIAAGSGWQASPDHRIDALALALVLGSAMATAVRRRWPLVTLGIAAALCSAYLIIGYPYGPIFFPFFVAVYTVAAYQSLNAAIPAALVALALLLPHLFTNPRALPGLLGIVPASAWVVVPFAIGIIVRSSRQARAREQAAAVRRRVDDERLRIAQEVHDVVGHGLASIKMQAEIALHLLPQKPEQAERALTAISRTSAEALDEVRATLGVMRRREDDRAPTPGLDRLGDLRQRMADAGLSVDIRITGSPRPLPPAVELAAYRLIQESLTNALRHGERAIATVRVNYHTDRVVVSVSNPVSGLTSRAVSGPDVGAAVGADPGAVSSATADRSTGLGIPGMSARVSALGGTFRAGPADNNQFEVYAEIPLGEQLGA